MTWIATGTQTSDSINSLLDRRLVVRISELQKKSFDDPTIERVALAFIDAKTPVAAATNIFGGITPAHVEGAVVDAIPLTDNFSLSSLVGTVVSVYPGQPLAVLAADSSPVLRYIDDRGVPWTIRGYTKLPEGFTDPVIGWTGEYGTEQTDVEGPTLDDVKKKIRAFSATHARNVPTLTSKDRIRDDVGPISIEDADGTQGPFGVWSLDNQGPKGKTYYYAARSSAFSSEVVGPALSIEQLRGDVSAYRDDRARASLGLLGSATASNPVSGVSFVGLPEEMTAGGPAATGATVSVATAPEASSSPLGLLLLGGLGLLLLTRKR
jgi:MYXO-CTERM domain-containing protein